MEWKPKIFESNDDVDLDIFFYQLFSEKPLPVVLYVHPEYYRKLEEEFNANPKDNSDSNQD